MGSASRRVIAGIGVAAGLGIAALGGLYVGEAREPGRLGASRFASVEAERAARQACESAAPFVVLDTFALFRPANLDDAPQEPQEGRPATILHGDIVAAIAEAAHPGTIAYQTDPVFNARSLAADFGRLARDIESGRIGKPAAIVSSIVLPVDLGQVNRRLAVARPFRQSDVTTRRRELLDALSGRDQQSPYVLIDEQLARLRKAGVPVFVAAGNTGPDETVNALALSDGVYAVGALDRDGGATAYTSAPGLVSVWSPGFVVLTEAPGGLSVSGGRGVELKGVDLPEQRAVIAAFAGKRAADVLLVSPGELRYLKSLGPSRQRHRYLIHMLEHGVYRTEDLMAAYGYPESSGTFLRALADGPYMHFPSDTIFRATVDGALLFDPIGDRSEGQLKVADATSFAAPNICAAQTFPKRVATAVGAR